MSPEFKRVFEEEMRKRELLHFPPYIIGMDLGGKDWAAQTVFFSAAADPTKWDAPTGHWSTPSVPNATGLSGGEIDSIYIGTPYDEDKKMSTDYFQRLYSMPGNLEMMSKMLGVRPDPLKPGTTIRGPDGREYIIAKAAPKPKAPKPVKKDYNTVGVRYLEGGNLDRVYTYRAKKGAKLHLGQEVVVPAKRHDRVNNFVAVVVEIHKTPQDTGPFEYRYVLGTVKPL